ncbi:MAG: prolyl oligopeptidase family serine peptidase [candidate division Zixibacteria bacterium]|nr:prolyl oligopeptidase family serine peptidase [candidate division Zixibacteria bacterium]
MKRLYVISIALIILFACAPQQGQEKDPSLLTLERIYSSNEFRSERFGPARWLEERNGYTTLERSRSNKEGRDIVLYDAETGEPEILVPANRLIPKGEKDPLSISNYVWSSDGQKLLIFTNTKRVWRQNTRGDYWVLDLSDWSLHKLGGDAEPSTLMFAKFSPDGNRVGYVVENNVYVEDLKNNRITQLTQDGSETIINGTFDWVYEEEFGLRDGWRWSPDGKWIAYWQLDAEGIKTFYLINNTDSLYPKLTPLQYPKVGETNSSSRIGVVSAGGGETRWFDLEGDPRNHYIARMDWASNSEEVIFQRLNRLQNTIWLMMGNIQNGKVRTILTERDKAWVEVVDDLHWLDDGNSFTWVSERDGWSHIYLASRAGAEVKCLTPGEYDVVSMQSIDEEGGWVYFIASPDNPTQRYLFRVPLDGVGEAERITPQEQKGNHRYRISPDSRWAFHTFSTFDEPSVTELVRLPAHEAVRILVENSNLRKKVQALKRQPVEFFRVDIGKGVNLDGWCMKPYDFDPNKRYPVLFYVYGEPAGSTVGDRWGGNRYLWHLMLTQQGYVVMSVDNRGTRVPRGREWRKCIYRQIGILASADQAAALRAIIKRWPWVDSNRIGIWGWSGGGSMSLNAIFRYPDLYKMAMAIAFVSNQRYYDTIYQERYMGLPEDNVEGFKNGSPITFAHQLQGNLLLIHGTGDDNVHYQNFEALVNELIKHNKHFTMMSYPNRSHGIFEGENTTRHLYELLTRYLKENL